MDDHESIVERLNPLDQPGWDAVVAQFPAASFFHTAAWARVLHDSYRFRPIYFVERQRDGKTAAIVPLMEVDSWVTGRRGISLPFTDECEPLLAPKRGLRRLREAISAVAVERRWKHWELRGGAEALNAPAAVEFLSHRLALCSDPSRVFARCASPTRRSVRKAEHAGLTVTIAHDLAATRTFHSLLCQTRRMHGMPPQPAQFFENIQRHILAPRHGCIVLAHLEGVPVAGAMFFHFGSTTLFKFGASDKSYQHLRPNNLVMWRAIEWHARSGFTSMDFGRTSLNNEGLRRFKLGWGATERRIAYTRFDCRSASFVTTPDRSTGWHSGLFRILPATFSRLVMAAAYKHVA